MRCSCHSSQWIVLMCCGRHTMCASCPHDLREATTTSRDMLECCAMLPKCPKILKGPQMTSKATPAQGVCGTLELSGGYGSCSLYLVGKHQDINQTMKWDPRIKIAANWLLCPYAACACLATEGSLVIVILLWSRESQLQPGALLSPNSAAYKVVQKQLAGGSE